MKLSPATAERLGKEISKLLAFHYVPLSAPKRNVAVRNADMRRYMPLLLLHVSSRSTTPASIE